MHVLRDMPYAAAYDGIGEERVICRVCGAAAKAICHFRRCRLMFFAPARRATASRHAALFAAPLMMPQHDAVIISGVLSRCRYAASAMPARYALLR